MVTYLCIYGDIQKLYACSEYLDIIPIMRDNCGFSSGNIPQLQDISDFLQVL